MCTVQGYLAPKKIDPKLFEPSVVFKQVEETKKPVDVMHRKQGKKQRQRQGYDDDVGQFVYKAAPVKQFIEGDNPVEMLGQFNAFTFDADSSAAGYDTHPATTAEMKNLCADLKLLGKADFKQLMRWRVKIRKGLKEEKAQARAAELEAKKELLTDEAKEEIQEKKLDSQLDEMRAAVEARERRRSKKTREMKSRERKRQMLNAHSGKAGEDEDPVSHSANALCCCLKWSVNCLGTNANDEHLSPRPPSSRRPSCPSSCHQQAPRLSASNQQPITTYFAKPQKMRTHP